MENNNEVELTDEQLEAEKQKIRDEVDNKYVNDSEDVKLPSEENVEDEPRVYAKVFKNVDELKKGIENIGTDLPEYILNGMSDDALEQHYVELRKARDSKPKDDSEEPKTDKPNENISDDLWSSLEKTFNETGSITDEQREQLEKSNIPKQGVDRYIEGLKAEQEVFTTKVYEIAGGEEEYNAIKQWAEDNYTQEELDIISSGNRQEVLIKLKGVKADYLNSVGTTNVETKSRLRGDGNVSKQEGYRSQDEWLIDRQSPEYRKDARFKAKVDAKFKASSFGS